MDSVLIFDNNSIMEIGIILLLLILIFIFGRNLFLKRRINKELRHNSKLIEEQAKIISESNKKLAEQNARLKELNEEKNNVIGIVSHDLKAPLNRIFALSNLIYLSQNNLNNEQRDYLEKMNQVVKEGLDLIRNLLDIRAIEYKGIKMRIEKVDVTKLLNQMIKSYQTLSEQKNLRIEFIGKMEPVFIKSDKQYLNRIFDNLLSNAAKFTPENREIRVVLNELGGDTLQIKVEDDGWGISDEDQKKLFQKYTVLSSKPTGKESSTGLGLSIAKSLVEMLGGKIYYEVGKNLGATFVVELPLISDP